MTEVDMPLHPDSKSISWFALAHTEQCMSSTLLASQGFICLILQRAHYIKYSCNHFYSAHELHSKKSKTESWVHLEETMSEASEEGNSSSLSCRHTPTLHNHASRLTVRPLCALKPFEKKLYFGGFSSSDKSFQGLNVQCESAPSVICSEQFAALSQGSVQKLAILTL